tara:strand:- start:149 stop:358 length:210 start_codon:yes stop_codon:yes gene_type:complete
MVGRFTGSAMLRVAIPGLMLAFIAAGSIAPILLPAKRNKMRAQLPVRQASIAESEQSAYPGHEREKLRF